MLCLMHYRCKRTILIYKDKKRMYIILQNTVKKHTRKSKLIMNIQCTLFVYRKYGGPKFGYEIEFWAVT